MRFQLEYLMSQKKILFLSSSLIRTRMIYCEVVLSVSTAFFFFILRHTTLFKLFFPYAHIYVMDLNKIIISCGEIKIA